MTKQDKSKPQASVAPSDTAAPSPALGPAPIGPTPASGPAAPSAAQTKDAPREQGSRDGLVVASILIVSAAITMMCYSQIGLSLPVSLATGAVALSLLMLIHKQVQKTAQIAQLKAELAQTRQSVKPKSAPSRPGTAPSVSAAAPTSAEARIRELSRDIGNLVPRADLAPGATGPTAAQASSTTAADLSALRSFPSSDVAAELVAERAARQAARAAAQSSAEAAAKQAVEKPAEFPISTASADEAAAAGIHAPKGEVVREQWSFRPRADAQSSVHDASVSIGASLSGGAPRAGVATTIEGDLELVQRKIKELADEVNAAEALRAPKPARPAPRAKSTGNALEDSIGALRAAASNMRARPSLGDFVPKSETPAFAPPATKPEPQQGLGELIIPATAERIAGSDSAGPASSDAGRDRDVASPRLELPSLPDLPTLNFPANSAPAAELPPRAAAIARAVEDDTIDVLLGPIVTLSEHSVSHYEMTAGLRSGSDERLDALEDDFALIGGELDTQFDIARLNRAAALATRMDARDRDGSLLAEFFGSSMTSRAFLESFARAYEARPRISAQLVLTLTQRGIDAFTPSAWQALQDMHAFGFRLALDKVAHMGTDFAALQRSGFRFVRFDAQALLEGMTTRDRFVPADEIIQRATLAGLSIIASGIPDAETQRRLLDAGILLGQGPLFGAARAVNVDGGGPADQSAAA